ncbi:hypothetical protein [Daejeonella oryzae]|uniref:hypothetical protein n=1 Tax=Daejeonella oryzae TaxID=1122943 RepID=UPI00047DAB51|nr:hypothetical protein [Daejeonella oryzae]
MKWIWSLLIGFAMFSSAQAQSPQNRSQQIEAVKVAFITQKLDLNTEEAEKFWPVYNNYQKEVYGLLKLKKQAKSNQDNNADDVLNSELEFEGRLLDIRKKYKQEFSKVIPSEKVLQLYRAEREFREHLIKELKERRKN